MPQDTDLHSMHSDSEDRSWKQIVADLIRDMEHIFRNELRLAATELKSKFQEATIAGALLAAAGVLGFFGMACVITACIAALHIIMPLWLSALVMGVLLNVAAGGAFLVGRMLLQEVDFVPRQTVESLKDNLEWAKTHVST